MEIVLYGIPVSVFVAKARIALDFKGLEYDEVEPPGGYGSAAYRAIVPAGSVPGLTLDGASFHGSNAIVELIEELHPDPPLLPAAPHARALTRALLDFHDNRLEAAARALFPLVKREWREEPDAVIAGVAAIESALARLEDLVRPRPFHLEETPTIADMAYPASIQMAEMLAAELERPLSPPPMIDEWRRAAAEIPAVARSLGIAGEAMELWLAQFR
ncbi:glutathione S-transferase family protein [Pikeienuella piscinae]|uniref:Glutathione S-transferase family protein n=1 Tax=Pikeienuella piscinae TaxID=2748098 RepID=A0A7L5BWM6_9RHOB|nr:glutathione S-transferase family protein [Pikeienuella piscinae]QIE56305.1 glutathione S-transferase family protein [Pikeienuella piscinae]